MPKKCPKCGGKLQSVPAGYGCENQVKGSCDYLQWYFG